MVRVGLGAQLDFLDFDNLLGLLGFAFLFVLLVQELAEVHDLHDGRLGLRRNFHQVQLGFARHPQSVLRRHDADVLAIGADQTDFAGPDLFVDSMVFGSDESLLFK